MDKYEEIMPMYSESIDYSVHFIENIQSPLTYVKHLIKKGEKHQKEYFLRKLPTYTSNPSLLSELLVILSQHIEQWYECHQLLFIEMLYQITKQQLSSLETTTHSLSLIETILYQMIHLIANLDDVASKETICYFDMIIRQINESANIKINIKPHLKEVVIGLGKFGQDKKHRRICAYLCSCLIQIGNDDNNELDSIYNRLLILFGDSENSLRLQLSNEIKYIYKYFNNKQQFKKDFLTYCEDYCQRKDDTLLYCTTLRSLIYNLNLLNSSMCSFVFQAIHNIFTAPPLGNVGDVNSNLLNVFIDFANGIIKHKTNSIIESYYHITTLQIFLKKYLFVQKNIDISLFMFENIIKHFDIIMQALTIITHDDQFYLRSIVEFILRILKNEKEEFSIENINNISNYIHDSFDQFICYLDQPYHIENLIQNKNDLIDIITNCNFVNLCETIYKKTPHDIFINHFFDIVLPCKEFFMDIHECFQQDTDIAFISFIKGIRIMILYVSQRKKIKKRDDIMSFLFNQTQSLLSNDKVCYLYKKHTIKLLPYIIKYCKNNSLRDKMLIYIFDVINNNNSFYHRRLIYPLLQKIFTLFSSTFIIEKRILKHIDEMISCSIEIPVEMNMLLQLLIKKNVMLIINDKDIEKKLNELLTNKQKHNFKKDIECMKHINIILEHIKTKKSNSNAVLLNSLKVNDNKLLNEETELGFVYKGSNCFGVKSKNSSTKLSNSLMLPRVNNRNITVKVNPQNKLSAKKLNSGIKLMPLAISQNSNINKDENDLYMLTDNNMFNKHQRNNKMKHFTLKAINKDSIEHKQFVLTSPNAQHFKKNVIFAKDKDLNLFKKGTPLSSHRYFLK